MSAMRDAGAAANPAAALARAHAVFDELAALDLTALTEDALLDYCRELERLRRRLPSLGHAQVVEIEGRELPGTYSVRTTAIFLRGLLRLDPGEAIGRVRAAHAAGPRRALTGEVLAPVFAQVATAQAAGLISERHARVIVEAVDKLPDAVSAEHGERVETDLVRYATQFDPTCLSKLAVRMSACYDPDGRLPDVAYRDQHRDLAFRRRVDGSGTLSAELTAEIAELLEVHFDAYARPQPAIDGVKDPRTAGQRRHDALLEALKLNLRAQQLPTVAGITATIVVTMTAQQYATRLGLACTSHGALIPVAEAMRWTGGEYRLMNVVLDKTRAITAYSDTARLYTENQRLALAAVDGGCTFPGCPAPATWCEIDHALPRADGGRTSIPNGLLACRYHNNHAKHQGWQSARINGRAAWTPPRWIDPTQTPRYNQLHDPGGDPP